MKTGIYQIINLLNNDIYIGSAARSLYSRWRQHKSDLKLNKHRNIHLQRAYNKYGKDNFIFEVIEYCESEKCIEREQYYMDLLKPRYNINPKASSGLGRKMTPEQCLAHGQRMKGKKAWNKGIPFSVKSRKKMSEARKGKEPWNKNKKCPRNKPILRNDGKIYPNIMTAAIDLQVKENTIIKACTDKQKVRRVRGYILNYLKKDG